MSSLGPLYILLREVSVWVLCPFFNWIVCAPGVESCEFFRNLKTKPLYEVSLANIFSHTVSSLMSSSEDLTKSVIFLYANC